LTAGLLKRLIASAPARIINTASNAHRKGHIDFNDLQSATSYRPFDVYATSKLCNILFTRELARRLSDHNVTVNSFSPGFVATRFVLGFAMRFARYFARSAEVGARHSSISLHHRM
jgi:NAD(P)-dependent dehydrogenase (short-subunit alcohol dehydrogenase family)